MFCGCGLRLTPSFVCVLVCLYVKASSAANKLISFHSRAFNLSFRRFINPNIRSSVIGRLRCCIAARYLLGGQRDGLKARLARHRRLASSWGAGRQVTLKISLCALVFVRQISHLSMHQINVPQNHTVMCDAHEFASWSTRARSPTGASSCPSANTRRSKHTRR